MIRFVFTIFLALFVKGNLTFAQTERLLSSKSDKQAVEIMKLNFSQPEGFIDEYLSECFGDNPKLFSMLLSCLDYGQHSKDGECVSFIQMFKPLTEEEISTINRLFPKHPVKEGQQHIGKMQSIVKQYCGEEAAANWKDYVHYYTEEQAKQKFNADTAVLLTISLEKEFFYKGKYSHMDALFLSKNNGNIENYLFYTDKAKRDIDQYRKGLEAMFWFRED